MTVLVTRGLGHSSLFGATVVLTTSGLGVAGLKTQFTTLMDAIRFKTGGGNQNEGLRSWFSATSAEALNDAERRWLLAFASTSSGTNADLWRQYLTDLGHTGIINEQQLQYWNNQTDP